MKNHHTDKKYPFYVCVAVLSVLLAGCAESEPAQPEETGISLPAEIWQETVQETEIPKETPTETEIADHNPGKETGFIHSYPLGATVSYDLNGDGKKEEITVHAQEYEDGTLMIGNASVKFMAISPTGYFTVLNVDQQSNDLLIGISDYGFSDDPVTVLYAYDGEQITEVGYYEDVTGENGWNLPGAVCHGDGTISAKTRFDILGTWEAQALYRVESGVLKDITDVYYYCTWEERPDGWEVTAKAELVMYEDIWNSETEVIIPAGAQLVMTGLKKGEVTGTYWVCFEFAGKTLWMAAETVEWHTYVSAKDGFIESEEAFDGFFYAG